MYFDEMNMDLKWDGAFTDPKEHDPTNFCYLVHALTSPLNKMGLRSYHLYTSRDRLHVTNMSESQNIDLNANAFDIIQKKIVSTSIINQDHTLLFGHYGLILAVNVDDVLKMSPHDGGTLMLQPDSVLSQERELMTVPELISQSRGYNEVVIRGAGVEVIGMIIKTLPKSSIPVENEEHHVHNLKDIIEFKGLPIVEIEDERYGDFLGRPKITFLDDQVCRFFIYDKKKLHMIDFNTEGKMIKYSFLNQKRIVKAMDTDNIPREKIRGAISQLEYLEVGFLDESLKNRIEKPSEIVYRVIDTFRSLI